MSPASAPRPNGAKASSRPTVVARQVGMILSRRGGRFSGVRRGVAGPFSAEARGGKLKRAPRLEIDLELRLALALRIGLAIDHLTEVRIGKVQIRAAQDHPVQQIEIRHAQFRFQSCPKALSMDLFNV